MRLSREIYLYLAWFQALVATLGSVIASEVFHLIPCSLCWYQRIFMFPLVIILGMGIYLKDRKLPFYVIPVAATGAFIAFYHVLLQEGFISEALVPCSAGVSCTTKYFNIGFITFPFLSMLGFLFIIGCMYMYKRNKS